MTMLEINPEIGKNAQVVEGEPTREAGYIHCPVCGDLGVYFESFTDTQVCTKCSKEFKHKRIVKYVLVVQK